MLPLTMDFRHRALGSPVTCVPVDLLQSQVSHPSQWPAPAGAESERPTGGTRRLSRRLWQRMSRPSAATLPLWYAVLRRAGAAVQVAHGPPVGLFEGGHAGTRLLLGLHVVCHVGTRHNDENFPTRATAQITFMGVNGTSEGLSSEPTSVIFT